MIAAAQDAANSAGPGTVLLVTTVISAVVAVLSVVAVLIKVMPDVRKMRAETKKVDIDAALAGDKAEDEHWQAIVKAQTEAIVQPLRDEVGRLSREVAVLRAEVETFRTRYWRAIAYIRTLLARDARHGTDQAPPAPAEIAADI